MLRALALKTELEESLKWGSPVYTLDKKNVLGLLAFKNHFGIWFFHGALLKDPKNVLQNSQEGKTKGMRHWKFSSVKEIDQKEVLAYILEAIENQKKGILLIPKKKEKGKFEIPELLKEALKVSKKTSEAFRKLTPFKQAEYAEYIIEAKQEKTKLSRLEKILPLISEGAGLNDKSDNFGNSKFQISNSKKGR
ncbi:MAG: DUF1801 domain-containing protein [Maribacter sp.]|nr:DUF1801 domain-containing protein [Maribacter sp.]